MISGWCVRPEVRAPFHRIIIQATRDLECSIPVRTPDFQSQAPMKVPKRLEPLVQEGLIDEVLGALKSGKEAAVYVVRADGVVRCAKVYKAVDQRGFHKQSRDGDPLDAEPVPQ
jgi:hypothetical protein